MSPLFMIGAVLSGIGTLASAGAYQSQAAAEQQAAEYKAAEEERRAQEERAAAQRKAMDKQREGRYAQSRLQALSAASGGGADDPTIIKLGADIAGQAEYNSLSEMWIGEAQAVDLENQAALDRYAGAMRAQALRSSAGASILSGFGGIFGNLARYG